MRRDWPDLRTHWPAAAVLLVCGVLYTWRLDYAPPYLGGDEAHFAVHGHAIATTGRSLDGTRLPLFVNLRDPQADRGESGFHSRWYQPILFYLTAAILQVAPLSETVVRLPVALIAGVVSPLLLYLVAWRLFARRWVALLAALLLAWSPTNLILGRQALDYLLPLPFVLGWLWCLMAGLRRGGVAWPALSGLLLGIGFYSYIASWIFMPGCLLLGTLALKLTGHRDWRRAAAVSAAGFAVALLPLIPWLAAHPEMLTQTFNRYQDPAAAAGPFSVGAVAYSFATFFDPWVLFVRGGPVPTTSLGRSGLLLVPAAVFLAVGLTELIRRRQPAWLVVVLLGGTTLAALPAALARETRMVQRGTFVLPFLILIACAGALRLSQGGRWARGLALTLVAALPLQFGYVYYDYFTHYRHRSAFYYDPVAFSEVAGTLLDHAEAPRFYLSRDLDDPGPKWRFYTTKHGQAHLLDRTHYVGEGAEDLDRAPAGSLLVIYDTAHWRQRLIVPGEWTLEREVRDLDDRPAALILRRSPRFPGTPESP